MGHLSRWVVWAGVGAACARPAYGQSAKPAPAASSRAGGHASGKGAAKPHAESSATAGAAPKASSNATSTAATPSSSSAQANSSAKAGAIAEAQGRFRRALELHDEGNLDAARAELQRAYDTAPNFRVLFNLAQVEFELLDYPAALATFQKYLETGGDNVPAERRVQVQADIEKLRGRVASLEITVDTDGAQVLIDDVAIGTTPLSQPIIVSAGRRRVTVTASGFSAETRLVETAGGDRTSLSFELEETTPPAPEPPPPPPTSASAPSEAPLPTERPSSDAVPWFGWGTTAILAGGAAVTGALALKASANLDSERNHLGADRGELDRLRSQASSLAIASDICAGAATFAGLLSLYFTVTAGSGSHTEQGRTLRLSPSLGFVSLDGSF